MSDRILLNPENRWLGSSSSNDFSLYGAQPDPTALLRPAQEDGSTGETGSSSAAASPNQSEGSEAVNGEGADVQQPQGSLLSSQPDPAPAAPASPGETAFMGPSTGDGIPTGSLIPLGLAAAAFPANPLVASTVAPAADAPAPLQAASAAAPAEAGSIAAPTLGAAGGAMPAPAETISLDPPTLQAAADAIPAAADVLTITVPADGGSPAGDITDILSDSATGAFATLGATDPAADTADDVQDLLGTDPAAGIATLVSLVSVSDVLPVTEAANDAGEAAEDPASDLLNSLAADPPESNLLGTGDDDDAPAAGLLGTPPPPADVDLPGGLG